MWDFLDNKTEEQKNKEKNLRKECRIGLNQTCPRCEKGKLDYNGLLNLNCPECGFETAASFT